MLPWILLENFRSRLRMTKVGSRHRSLLVRRLMNRTQRMYSPGDFGALSVRVEGNEAEKKVRAPGRIDRAT